MPTTKPVDSFVLRNQRILDKRPVGNTIGAFAILNMIALCGGGAIYAQTYNTPIIEYWGLEQNNSSYEEYKKIREKNGNQTTYNFGGNSTINYSVNGSTALKNPKDVAIYVMSHGSVNTPPIGNSFTINGNLSIQITDNKNDSTKDDRASTSGIAFHAGKSSLTANDSIFIETSSKAIDGDAYSLGVTIQNLGAAASSSGSRPAIGENTVSFNKLNIELLSTTEGGNLAEAYGVEMRGNSSITIDELEVSAKAGGAANNYAQGILATDQYELSGGTITINKADITTVIEGYGKAIGVESFLESANTGSTIHIENGSISAQSMDGQGEAYGVYVQGQSCTVTLGSDTAESISIRAQGGYVNHAIHSFDGTVTAKANRIDLQADDIIYADGGSISVTSLKTGTLNGNVVTAFENAVASLDLRGDTHWTGATSRVESSDINLALKDVAKWSMTDDSALSTLTMDGGIVELAQASKTRASQYRTLTADNLSGAGGVFKVNTDIENDQTDQIIVGNGTGTHQILVTPTGTGANVEEMNSFIVQQQAGDASFSLANKDGKVEQGLYFYELAERTGTNGQEWYLKRTSSNIIPETPTGETEASLSGLAGHYAMWYGQLTDLRKRLGEMHDGTQTGLWVRGFADKFRLKGLAGSGFSQDLYGGSVGYDTVAATNGNCTWIVGVQFRSAHADQQTNGRWGGRGDLTSVGGGLYSTWVHSKGWYVDLAATMDWYDHTIQANMSDGTRVNDDRSSYGIGASLEAGRKVNFGFSNEGRNYWFMEPQFEVSYFWLKGGNFATSNGMKIDQDDMDSLTARAGLVLGKKFALNRDNAHFVQPYVKAGLNHEFMGEQEARLNGVRLFSDLKGTRGYYGLGVDWQATDNLRLYMQAEREHGEEFTREYNISGGLKWKF